MPPAHGASRLYDWQDDDDSGNDSPAAFSTVSVGGTLRGKQAQPSRAPMPGRAQPKRGSGRTSAPSRTSRTEFLFGADALPLGQPDDSSVRQGSRPHRGASLDLEFGDDDRRRGRTRSEKSRRRISAAGPPEELPTTRRLGCVHCALVCGLFLLAAAGFVGWAAATSEPPAATTTPAAVGQAAGHASPLSPPPPPPPRPAAPPPPPPSPPPPPPFVPALVLELNEQWRRGAPSNDLEAAGVLVHVLDGRGVTVSGFVGGSIPTAAEMWSILGNEDHDDRLAGSLISSRYPDMFQLTARRRWMADLIAKGFSHLPGVVIDAAAAQQHFSCCYPFDGGTMRYNCPAGSQPKCRPGCVQTNDAFWGGRPSWYYDFGSGRELASCLGEMVNNRQCPQGLKTDGWCTRERECGTCWVAYNEIILERGVIGARVDYQSLVRAVFVSSEASDRAVAFARAVRDEAAAHGVDVPLLRYDRKVGFSD